MATRKITREASNDDLAQMQSLFGGSTSNNVKPVKQEEQVIQNTQDKLSNLSNSDNKQIESVVVQTPAQIQTVAVEKESKVITEENKSVSDTTVGIRMTTAKKREMKAYFIQHGTTMSQGVIDAFTLLKTLEAEGKIAYKDGLLERV